MTVLSLTARRRSSDPVCQIVLDACAREFKVPVADILGDSRFPEHWVPRCISITVFQELSGRSNRSIAALFDLNESSVRRAVERARRVCSTDTRVAARTIRVRSAAKATLERRQAA